ncbi:hypothetical protein HanHA300_Chr14g0528801 [Helianthus annuus]|nr:hypothetical protein HanHA300_Chr14g0528801 [Helianthus annuus]
MNNCKDRHILSHDIDVFLGVLFSFVLHWKCVWSGIAGSFNIRHHQNCQGGTRSICVFADEMGSSSVSSLIVTGGKGGDVGVHDFRYIATRRPKKHKNSDNDEQKFSASSTAGLHNKHRDQNGNGMLWYIPKAHSGKFLNLTRYNNTLPGSTP